MRFIVQYYNNTGRPSKKHFIALERGYHGSSSTGAGLTALPAFHRGFDLPLPTQHYIPSPNPYRHPAGADAQALIAASVADLRAKVAELGADNVAAFFCEPIQGSGGVIVPPAGWLKAMREAARELDILFVVDEVITGFGRTGPMFACDAEGVEPDIMTMAKGLTAGYAPMGATLLSDKVYAGIADGAPKGAPIGHGATYSAHPVSAAVALEVLRLYEEGGILANGQHGAAHFAAGLDMLRGHPWSATRATAACSAHWNWSATRPPSAASTPSWASPTASSPPATATASCSAPSATTSSASHRHWSSAKRNSPSCSSACARRSTKCWTGPTCGKPSRSDEKPCRTRPQRAHFPPVPPACQAAMNEAFKIDRLDLRILAQLQKNGRMTNVDLADAVGLSPSPCLIRVKRLEQAGYIAGYGAHLRLEKLGDTLTVFTEVTLSDHRREDFARFEAALRRWTRCWNATWSAAATTTCCALSRGVNHYQEVIEELLQRNIGIAKYFSYIVIKSPFIKTHCPIERLFPHQR